MFNIKLYGIVQGVGFRPFVARLAAEHNILGTVANKGSFVEIFATGENVDIFTKELKTRSPARSHILAMDVEEIDDKNFSDFSIIESEKLDGVVFVSPDIAICEDCKRELFDKNNRRYHHPFINCTACGPRLTIMDAMPYDRERTSMGEFPMCETCETEYTTPENRRYDAQPVCCNKCGPEYYLLNRSERGKDAIKLARKVLMNGGIVAIKGIGGFHLACDAGNEQAVQELRKRKNRPVKPFALMAKDFETLKAIVNVPENAVSIITGPQKPILLLPRKKSDLVAPSVAKDNPYLGVMLPYAPIQCLLFYYDENDEIFPKVLVMTSGNPSGAPICHNDDEAEQNLKNIADVILSNNRRIRLRSDDSVTAFFEDSPYMVRRSRGYAPIPIILHKKFKGEALAIGGELKNTFCLAKDNFFYPSPFIGDMTDLRSIEALKDSVNLMKSLLEINPQIVACDLHPRYNATMVAKEANLPLFYVQHHYAHILSCMTENYDKIEDNENVLGVAFDGTGYGTDGTVWGGEILLANAKNFERLAHIETFLQAGGDKVPREGWRVALYFLFEKYGGNIEKVLSSAQKLNLATTDECQTLCFMLKNNLNTIKSSSAGRLFDAISAILGIRTKSTFEGEAAIYLEFAALKFKEENPKLVEKILREAKKNIRLTKSNALLATKNLVKEIINQKLNGEDEKRLAFIFHANLATRILSACLMFRDKSNTVALSGGVFQNLLFTKICKNFLEEENFKVLTHKQVPPNDGGIALGQAFAAMARLEEGKL